MQHSVSGLCSGLLDRKSFEVDDGNVYMLKVFLAKYSCMLCIGSMEYWGHLYVK